MIMFETVTDYGQLKKGDVVLVKDNQRYVFPAQVKEVIMPGTPEEEIIFSKGRNLYFIVGMYLDKRSWVKECAKIVGGRIFSLSNTVEAYT